MSKSTWWEQLGEGRGEEEEEDGEDGVDEEEEDGEEEEEVDEATAVAEALPALVLTERGRFRQ